jgi:hypothetical protein
MDASQQVLLQVLNLKQLGKQDEAERIGREFLAAPGADADADALARLRKALGD